MMTIQPEFETLVNRYMDGMSTAEDVRLLNELLRADATARQAFADLVNLDAALGALAAEATFVLPASSQDAPGYVVGRISRSVPGTRTDLEIRPTLRAAPARARMWLAGGVVAAGLLVAVLLATLGVPWWNRSAAEVAIARLTGAAEAVWAEGASAPVVGDGLGKKPLRLKSGTVEITIDAGVVLTLVGPAEAELLDARRLRVHHGRVTAEVGPDAAGFSIETAQARVVDFGTKFGVDVSEAGHTDVVVLQGEVRVFEKTGKATSAAPVATLTTGQAVRVDKSRRLFRIVNVTSDGREEDWSTRGGLPADSILTAVRDSMEGDYPSLRNFYRIVPGGMREDARAYADYSHEWNGRDAQGMPDWLLGADLVQTFNTDQVNWFMQLTVTVSRPCVLYVLADRRNPPPAWLSEQFSDTGVDIGLEYVDPKYKIFPAQGPGKGRTVLPFGIWKREVQQPGDVKLGPPYFEKFRDASEVRPNFMYGIAAKALPK